MDQEFVSHLPALPKGEVVGVVVSSVAVPAFLTMTGTLPQNLNWAVKAEYARPLFEPPLRSPAPPPGERQSIGRSRHPV